MPIAADMASGLTRDNALALSEGSRIAPDVGERVEYLAGPRLFFAAAAATLAPVSAQAPSAAAANNSYQLSLDLASKDRKPVPFELVHGLIVFRARVNGHEAWAQLDSGSQRSFIDAAFAKSCGLVVGRSSLQIYTPTGSYEAGLVPGVTIEIPGQAKVRATLAATDLSTISKPLGKPISLIVGSEMFQTLAVVIKPSEMTFEFWPSTALTLQSDVPRMAVQKNAQKLDLKDNRPHLAISVDGKPAIVAVDLGDNDILALSDSAWNRLGLNKLASVQGTSVNGDGHPVTTRTTIVNDLSVGPVDVHNIPVVGEPFVPLLGDGLIGMGFFRHYDFIIDERARRIWLLSPVLPTPAASASAAN